MSANELDQSEAPEGTSQEPATPSAPDLEAIVRSVLEKNLSDALNARFSGLQSVIDRKIGALSKELKSAGLSQEQQDELVEQEQARESAKALQIAELIKRRKSRPEAVDFFIEVMEKTDLDEQLAFIQEALGSRAAAQVAKTIETATPASGGAPSDAPVPDVDKNNPASRRSPSLESGEEMNDELADTILSSIGKGMFSRLTGRG